MKKLTAVIFCAALFAAPALCATPSEIFFPLEDDEECVNIFMPNEEPVMILELTSARKQYSTLAVYSLKGERLYETPGRSPIFWIDGSKNPAQME